MSKYPGRNYGSITNQPNGGGDKKAGLASRATHYFIANATGSNYYTQTAHPKFNFHLKCSNQLGGVGNIKGNQSSAIADGQRNCGEGCEFILDNEKSSFMKDSLGEYAGGTPYFINASGYTVSGDNFENISLTGLLPIYPTKPCTWDSGSIRFIAWEITGGDTPGNLEVSENPQCESNIYYKMRISLIVEGFPVSIEKKLIKNGFLNTNPLEFSPQSDPVFSTYQIESNQDMEISFCGERIDLRQGPFTLNGNSNISYIQDSSNVGFNPHIIANIYNVPWHNNQPDQINPSLNYSYLDLIWYSNEINYNKIINAFSRHQFKDIYKFNLKLA